MAIAQLSRLQGETELEWRCTNRTVGVVDDAGLWNAAGDLASRDVPKYVLWARLEGGGDCVTGVMARRYKRAIGSVRKECRGCRAQRARVHCENPDANNRIKQHDGGENEKVVLRQSRQTQLAKLPFCRGLLRLRNAGSCKAGGSLIGSD